MKECVKCNLTKAEIEFNKNSRAKDGLCSYCKACAKLMVTIWRQSNPEKRKANQAAHYQKHKERYKERSRTLRQTSESYRAIQNKAQKKARLKSLYGLTEQEIIQMVERQNNKCALCFKVFGGKQKPVVDHCHSSGVVRDILCTGCNTSLGHIEKDGFLTAALIYLEKHSRIRKLQKQG